MDSLWVNGEPRQLIANTISFKDYSHRFSLILLNERFRILSFQLTLLKWVMRISLHNQSKGLSSHYHCLFALWIPFEFPVIPVNLHHRINLLVLLWNYLIRDFAFKSSNYQYWNGLCDFVSISHNHSKGLPSVD